MAFKVGQILRHETTPEILVVLLEHPEYDHYDEVKVFYCRSVSNYGLESFSKLDVNLKENWRPASKAEITLYADKLKLHSFTKDL